MKGERMVGGLRCSEVLGDLSEYLDGSLAPDVVAHIEDHLRGCDLCERFGGEMAATVRALRQKLSEPDPLPAEAEERLRKRLDSAMASD
jgi:anti-sigma factor RsiW